MGRTPDHLAKLSLLDAVVDHVAANGLGFTSLRTLAAGLEVSPNRLVHHFGCKADLVAAVLDRAVERQEQQRAAWLAVEPDITQADLLRRWWSWLCDDPSHLALARLGIEAVTLDATHTGVGGDTRDRQISVWRANIQARLVAAGLDPDQAVVEASLTKALFTGLVVDLLASGDVERLTRALEVALERLERDVARQAAGSAP